MKAEIKKKFHKASSKGKPKINQLILPYKNFNKWNIKQERILKSWSLKNISD